MNWQGDGQVAGPRQTTGLRKTSRDREHRILTTIMPPALPPVSHVAAR